MIADLVWLIQDSKLQTLMSCWATACASCSACDRGVLPLYASFRTWTKVRLSAAQQAVCESLNYTKHNTALQCKIMLSKICRGAPSPVATAQSTHRSCFDIAVTAEQGYKPAKAESQDQCKGKGRCERVTCNLGSDKPDKTNLPAFDQLREPVSIHKLIADSISAMPSVRQATHPEQPRADQSPAQVRGHC